MTSQPTKAKRGSVKRRVLRFTLTGLAMLFLGTGLHATPMSGTYTVCSGSGCNYSTIDAAVTDLKTNGINGATTIAISAGDYNETISISGISGVSSSNTLTFKGTGSTPTATRIHNTNYYVVELNSISYVTLQNMHIEQETYSTDYIALDINSCSNCTIKSVQMTASMSNNFIWNHSAMRVQYSTDMLVENCVLRGGGYAALDEGSFNYGNARNVYRNNRITQFNYIGVMAYYGDNNQYIGNYVDSAQSGYGTALQSSDENGALYSKNLVKGFNMSTGIDISGTGQVEVTNNMITVGGNAYAGLSISPYSSSAVINVWHNTVHVTGSSTYTAVSIQNWDKARIDFRNNNMTRSNSSGYLMDHYGITKGDRYEGNNYYRPGSGTIINFDGNSYSTFAKYLSAASAWGTGQFEQNTQVIYKAAGDLHLDQNSIAPYGKAIGILKDYDGDTRCTTFPTSGADESTYANNPNYKKPSGTKFTGPSKAYIGNPTVYFNSAAAGTLAGYMWYVNGVFVTDSMHLRTNALTYPSSKVKLVAYNCGGKDSFETTITVDSPATVPSSDFISDVNIIRQGETVQFTDISTGYPAEWLWEITPTTGIVNGNSTDAYKFVYGDEKSDINRVRFDVPGVYQVCLTASNVRGAGNQECKVDYIEVTPSVTLKAGVTTLSSPSGYIYDNGGPNENTIFHYGGQTPLPSALIDACADSVYLVFKSFDMICGYGYVRVFEGKSANGKPLHPCTNNRQFGSYGPGLTNDGCTQGCSPLSATHVDTFRASKYMYIEMEENNWPGGGAGFEAYYWTKPRKMNPPVASFTSVDSVCTNGQVMFNNTTTGQDVTYLWDLDDDLTYFEATSKNTNWPYFAPGQYNITLIAVNCGGVDTFTKTINVFNPDPPVTSFVADNINPTTSDVVFLSTDMPMCIDDYRWTITAASGSGKASFVDGTRNTSSNPHVMFSDTGCYDVNLVTTNSNGEDSLKLNCFIKVRGSYCVPAVQNKAVDLGISLVKFHTINNSSPQGLTPYTNYALDQTKSTTIEIGVTYDLTVARNTNKNKISRTAWIDWNADGDFADAGEKVGEQLNSSTLSWTTQVKVPTLAKVGATLMRIAVNQGSQSNTPCGPNVFGEFEDYRVYVRPDATKPVITLLGDDTVYVEQGYGYTDPGATAYDNLDGNITSKMKPVISAPSFNNMIVGQYIFKYNVTDAAGNQADEARRVVIVTPDKTGPQLIVDGNDTIYVEVFDATFTNPAVLFDEDLVDGSLLGQEIITGNVNINIVGTYEVKYSITDASGNNSTVKRVIIVRDTKEPVITLVGNNNVTHEVGTRFIDSGVTLSDNYYSEAELRKVLVVQNNVDTSTLGTYTVVYTLTDPSGNGPVTITRTVIVEDSKAPLVTLNGDNPYFMEGKTKFIDPGVTIMDNYDKNLTDWDTSGTFYATFPDGFATTLDTFDVIYYVTDASGNAAQVTRTVIVGDRTPPVAELLGEPVITVCRWSNYQDAGYAATDNFDKTSDLIIKEEGSFTLSRTQKPGGYALRYRIEDKSGNITYTGWRTIIVLDANVGDCITGIRNPSDMSSYVNVYPNPSSGRFTVDVALPNSEQVKITVTNLVGQQIAVVAEGMMSADTYAVDLSAEPSGIYMVNIQTATQNIVKRIVINR
jgi:PKD repeat protein